MFVELENIDLTKIKFFIVGTGPASYCVAKKLEEKKISCLMIEAGDIEYSDESQEYYEGETEGNNAIISLSGSRLRQYGGTSGHWSGLCRTLDSYDFKNWTIDKEELTPYEKQTLQILNFKTNFLKDQDIDPYIKLINFKRSENTFRINSEKNLKSIKDSIYINVILNSYVGNIYSENNEVKKIEIYNSKKKIFNKINVQNLILGCGAIENSRILLFNKKKNNLNFLNDNVGKYFLLHPHSNCGIGLAKFTEIKETLNPDYNTEDAYFLAPTEKFLFEKNVNNCAVRIMEYTNISKDKEFIRDLICISPKIGEGILRLFGEKETCSGIKLFSAWEQNSKYDNEIMLSKVNSDVIGIPKVVVKSNFGVKTKKNLSIFLNYLSGYFVDLGLGSIGINNELLENNSIFSEKFYSGNHHMGGTRIGHSSKSVVDNNLKVHNSKNLFVVGSSVFASSGHANPTFTICQLSLKLGDHLAKNYI